MIIPIMKKIFQNIIYMKDRYDKLMIQYGGSIPFKVLAKEQEKERKELMKAKKRNKRKKANTRRKKKPSKNKSKCDSNCKSKCDSRCNVTDGNNMNNPNALGYCSYCVPEGVMIKGKDGKIYRNKKKEWIKI